MCVDRVWSEASLKFGYLDQPPYSTAESRDRANARRGVLAMHGGRANTTSRLSIVLRVRCW